MEENLPSPLIIFDGYCGLCQGFIKFVIKKDKKGIFNYTPRDSSIGVKVREDFGLQDIESILFFNGEKVFYYSDASLEVFKLLGFPLKALYVFKLVPKFIRDSVYHLVAKLRYRIFGKTSQCYVPSQETKSKFV